MDKVNYNTAEVKKKQIVISKLSSLASTRRRMCKCCTDPTIVAVKGILSITEEAKADTQSTKMMATAKRWSSGTTWN